MKCAWKVKAIFTEDEIVSNRLLVIEKDKIVGLFSQAEVEAMQIPVKENLEALILPGMVDTHIHGAVGADTMDATPESLKKIGDFLLSEGTTAWQPTTVTASLEDIYKAVANVKACEESEMDSARIIGCFVEGPYISKEYKGAHPEALIRPLSCEEMAKIKEAGLVSVIAAAPEKEGAEEFVRWAVQHGIKVSLAHSKATYEESCQAIAAGADAVVHTFCGMAPLHHRSPNLLGAALVKDEVYAELIADGIHVQTPAMQVLLRCKPKDKVLLVSDAIQATGLPDGEYMLGVEPICVKNGISRVRNGSLAGSTATLLQEVRRLIVEVGENPLTAVKMGSLNPSRRFGVDGEIGSIKAGKKADFLLVDKNYQLKETWLDGKCVVRKF